MNCLFCNTPLFAKQFTSFIFQCTICPVITHFTRHFPPSKDLVIIDFTIEPYVLELNLDRNKCTVYKGLCETNIISINYCPNITPDNANFWLTKLLNLTSFK